MIIYLDALLVKEIFFNSIILFLTGKITNQKIKFMRLILSSLFGGVYSIIIILTNYNLSYNTFINFFCAIIMNMIAFKNKDINSFIKNIITFYLITFGFGGLNLYVENYKINLYVTIILTLIVVPLFIKQYKSKFKLDLYYGEIFLDGEDKKLKTFIDTGNNLITCYDEPVIILSNEHQLIKRVDVKNLRRVSYKTINEKEVVVNGIRIEKIIMEYRNEMYINEAVLIESNVKFDGYDAIIGLEFFERAQKISKKERENTNGYFIVNKSKG